jgi:phosphoglycerate dehydrogenase-like enzyme
MPNRLKTERTGWRKLVVSGMALGAGIVALFTGIIDGDQFVRLAGLVVGLYGAGNVGEHVAKSRVTK